MLFLTKVPLRCGRNKPGKSADGDDPGTKATKLCGIGIFSAEKRYLGDENVATLLRGTQARPHAIIDGRGREFVVERWFVVEREDNLDEVFVRTLDGPFVTEQEAERVAGGRRVVDEETGRVDYLPPAIEAPELVSVPDDIGDAINAEWRRLFCGGGDVKEAA